MVFRDKEGILINIFRGAKQLMQNTTRLCQLKGVLKEKQQRNL